MCLSVAEDLSSIVYLSELHKTILAFGYRYLKENMTQDELFRCMIDLDWERVTLPDILDAVFVANQLNSPTLDIQLREICDSLQEEDRLLVTKFMEDIKKLALEHKRTLDKK